MAGPDDERSGGGAPRRADDTGSGSEKRRHGAVAVVFACATPLAVLVLPTAPALVATPILAVGALVAGITARRAARRTGGTAPGTVTAIAIGALGLCTALLLAPIVGPLASYESCVESANTVQDKKTCDQTLDDGVQSRIPFASPALVDRLTG